jgi:hypothetical protein
VPGGAPGRAVRNDDAEPAGEAEDTAADRERGERGTPEVADDSRVDEDVQRLRGQCYQCR